MTSIIEKLKISQSNSRKLDAFFSFSLFLVFFFTFLFHMQL